MRLADGVLQRLLQRLPAMSFLLELCRRFHVEVAAIEVNRLAVAHDVFELMVTTLLRHRFDR
jgi:hypothetical protein